MIKPAYKHYLKLPYWSNLEAVCLLSEICPAQYMDELPFIFHAQPLSGFFPCPPKIEMFQKFMRPIEMEFELSNTDSVVPIKAIEWAINKGFEIPIELKEFAKSKTSNALPAQQDDAPKEKTSKYQERNNDFMAWRESETPPLDKMTKPKIHERLRLREKENSVDKKLWANGDKSFDSWFQQQEIYKPKKGRKTNVRRKTKTI